MFVRGPALYQAHASGKFTIKFVARFVLLDPRHSQDFVKNMRPEATGFILTIQLRGCLDAKKDTFKALLHV